MRKEKGAVASNKSRPAWRRISTLGMLSVILQSPPDFGILLGIAKATIKGFLHIHGIFSGCCNITVAMNCPLTVSDSPLKVAWLPPWQYEMMGTTDVYVLVVNTMPRDI